MAYRNCISADHNAGYRFTASSGSIDWDAQPIGSTRLWVKLGNRALGGQISIGTWNSSFLTTNPIWFAMKLWVGSFEGSTSDHVLMEDNVAGWRVVLENTTNDLLVLDSTGATIQTITAPFSIETEYELAVRVVPSATVGEIEVFIDGTGQGNNTNQDLAGASAPQYINVTVSSSTLGPDLYFRAFILTDDDTDPRGLDVSALRGGSTSTVGGDTLDGGSMANTQEDPPNDTNFAQFNAVPTGTKEAWIQTDGNGDFPGPSGLGWSSVLAHSATYRATQKNPSVEDLAPDAIIVQTNLSGSVTDIDDDPAAPDANWLTASGMPVFRCSFPTPTIGPDNVGSSSLRFAVRSNGGAGGTEDEVPTSIVTQTGYSGAVTLIDEDPQSPGGDWMYTTAATSELVVEMDDPSGALDDSTDAQTLEIYLGKCDDTPAINAGGGDPPFTIEIYDGASLHETLATGVSLTSGGQLFTYNWTSSGLSSPNNVRVRITSEDGGGGPNKRFVAIDAVRWVAALGEATLNGTLRLYENGVDTGVSSAFTIAPSEGAQLKTLSFDSTDLSDISGADIEAYLIQDGTDIGEYIEIGAVECSIRPEPLSIDVRLRMGHSGAVPEYVTVRTVAVSVVTNVNYLTFYTGSILPATNEYLRHGFAKSGNNYTTQVSEIMSDVLYTPSGGSVTLDAETGAFTLAGQDAAFKRSLILKAETGEFTLTGQNADLNKSYRLAAETGAFSLAGSDADLLRQLRLEAETGAFALSGEDALFKRALILEAEAGSFTLSGEDANIARSYRLDAETGAFTFSGNDANLLAERLLSAETGAFSLAGQDALFKRALLLEAETGSFALTGSDADFFRSFTLQAETGAFNVSGQSANLLASRLLSAETAAFTLSGGDVDFIYAVRLDAETGSFLLAGEDVAFKRSLILRAETGNFTLSGEDAQLIANRQLQAESASFVLSGFDVDFVLGFNLQAETASFTLTGSDAALTAQRVLKAETGVFNLSGSDANLIKTILFDAETGEFTLTGNDAALTAHRVLKAETGVFNVSGENAALNRNYRLDCVAGAFAFSGENADFRRSLVVGAETGSFVLNGEDARLAAHRRMDCVAGEFTFSGADAAFIRGFVLKALTGDFTVSGQNAEFLRALRLQAESGVFQLTGFDVNLNYESAIPSPGPSFRVDVHLRPQRIRIDDQPTVIALTDVTKVEV